MPFDRTNWRKILVAFLIGVSALLIILLLMPLVFWGTKKIWFACGVRNCLDCLQVFDTYATSVGVFFTGLAFVGLVVTIWQQGKHYRQDKETDHFFLLYKTFLDIHNELNAFEKKEEFKSGFYVPINKDGVPLNNFQLYHKITRETYLFFEMIVMAENSVNGNSKTWRRLIINSLSVNQKRNYYVFSFITEKYGYISSNRKKLLDLGYFLKQSQGGNAQDLANKIREKIKEGNNMTEI